MKNILLVAFAFFIVLSGCDEETPVDTGNSDTFGDARDAVLGEYTCNYAVFSASTGVEDRKGTFDLQVFPNSDDDSKFDFREDGLVLFMTGDNLTEVSNGFSFVIPEQDVEGFGNIKGKAIINVPGQTTKVEGHFVTDTRRITVYCERSNKIGQDDDIFEFQMSRK
ncbi:MAG: hypothetical protein JJ975_16570 [Bacteroidia bacterium]|nr:hypothetical protein [Bacteroidia bacterium]